MTHNHDPLCPDPENPLPHKCIDCDLIYAARQDEREQAIKDCIAAVDALTEEMRDWSSSETLAAVKAAPQLTVEQWIWAQGGARQAAMVLRSLLEGEQS